MAQKDIKSVLERADGPMTVREITEAVEAETGRRATQGIVRQGLAGLGRRGEVEVVPVMRGAYWMNGYVLKGRRRMETFGTALGRIECADSLEHMRSMPDACVDLVVTSPPYALVVPRAYGNETGDAWVEWFRPFAVEMRRVLRDTGSLVLNVAGTWEKGTPERSLYIYKLPVMMCEELGWHLAQDFYWYHPQRIPCSPWVTVKRERVKDSVEQIHRFSKTASPKASNRRVLQPAADGTPRPDDGAQTSLDALEGFEAPDSKASRGPSGHMVVHHPADPEGAIPPNVLAFPNVRPDQAYDRWCASNGLPVHPPRYDAMLPDYFIRFLTDPGDLVLDPFAGSCTTGYAAEAQGRRWLCVEKDEAYCKGAVGRFKEPAVPPRSDARYALVNPTMCSAYEDEPIARMRDETFSEEER